jgi:hypothetical protein
VATRIGKQLISAAAPLIVAGRRCRRSPVTPDQHGEASPPPGVTKKHGRSGNSERSISVMRR